MVSILIGWLRGYFVSVFECVQENNLLFPGFNTSSEPKKIAFPLIHEEHVLLTCHLFPDPYQ